jgi:hypothetical protein
MAYAAQPKRRRGKKDFFLKEVKGTENKTMSRQKTVALPKEKNLFYALEHAVRVCVCVCVRVALVQKQAEADVVPVVVVH